jgi:CheY-like chemotaxis protein
MPAPIVIVDSNHDGLEMYVTALALEGIEAASATTATEALDVIARTHPRAVVTELRLPGAAGTDLISRVRLAEPDTFIVGLSTSGGREISEAKAAGCDVVLRVPCLPETLVKQLQHALFD